MGKLVISENVTLDGVLQDPMGTDGTKSGGWFLGVDGADREAWAEVSYQEAAAADAMLLGATTYRWLEPRWADREGPWAERLRDIPKYVVSSTLTEKDLTWGDSRLVTGDVADIVAKLKAEHDGEIVVNGSGLLARKLIHDDLMDELRLMLCPFVAGSGDRVFGATDGTKSLRLVGSRTVGDRLVLLTYQPVRSA